MPNRQAHLRQARHNQDLISTLDPGTTPFLDWIVTIAFYAALHHIEAWLAVKGIHLASHQERDDWIHRVKELRRHVWPAYKELEFQSRQARYQCVTFNRTFVQNDLLPLLNKIENEVVSLP